MPERPLRGDRHGEGSLLGQLRLLDQSLAADNAADEAAQEEERRQPRRGRRGAEEQQQELQSRRRHHRYNLRRQASSQSRAEPSGQAQGRANADGDARTRRNWAPQTDSEEWRPSLVVGESLGENLSVIEAADRNIAQRRAIYDWHRRFRPGALAVVEASLEAAIRERNAIADTVETRTPINELASAMDRLVVERVCALGSVLASSTFAPERANIGAAMAGYESGAIRAAGGCYTLIWAGRIVDACPTYGSFLADRAQRLDRYAALHGPGWLWWEPPLVPNGDGVSGATALAQRGVCLPNYRKHDPDAPGYYKVRMGFRRLRPLVTRPAEDGGRGRGRGRTRAALHEPDPSAPFMFYSVLLDSGASLPCLYESDVADCGIDAERYSAQSVTTVSSLEGESVKRTYEMEAGVFAGDDATLVDDASVWPAEPAVLSCVTEVVALAGVDRRRRAGAGTSTGFGFDLHRLSGMVPFNVAYMSSAPGMGAMWLGADRRDVLGAHRMPGQLRAAAVDAGHPTELWPGLASPTAIRFEHRRPDGTVLVDEEQSGPGQPSGLSVTTLYREDAARPQPQPDHQQQQQQRQGANNTNKTERGDGKASDGSSETTRTLLRTVRVEPRRQVRQKRALLASSTERASGRSARKKSHGALTNRAVKL